MSVVKENPILFGCLGLLGLMSLIACSGVVVTYLMADKIVEKAGKKLEELGAEAGKQAGLKDPIGTATQMMSGGWSFGVHVQNEAEVEFTIIPLEPRNVDCAALQQLLFPHLSGTKETVIAKSENKHVADDGTVSTTDVECRWSGYPGSNVIAPASAPAPGASCAACHRPGACAALPQRAPRTWSSSACRTTGGDAALRPS